MNKGKYVFSQLLDFLDRNDFNYLARKYGGDRYVKLFTCYNQLALLMLGQLSNRERLHDVVLATQVHSGKAYRFGFGMHVSIWTACLLKGSTLTRYAASSIGMTRTSMSLFSSLTALDISPMMVAELYHQRWQIELFFKWLKQHLKIKKFGGNSENAVRIQIYSAIVSYCMMAIVQKKMGINRSIYEMLQIVSVSLTDTTPLRDLFCKPNCNNVNERYGSTEPSLFDYLTF